MTTGIPSVNDLPLWYRLFTLLLLIPFAWYDVKHHKIRNAALLAFFPWCLLSVLLNLHCNSWLPLSVILLYHLLGFLSGSIILLTVSLVTAGSIGGGDIKMIALLGMLYGIRGILCLIVVSCVLAILYLGLQHLRRKQHPKQIAFMPYLLTGCIILTIYTCQITS